ncbi:V-set domain-containing T-cell activation inhibitor 1-like [Hoplias malabaricus]|uniref:V-set domain-containing T-cell activation inhibitor 1-like n=1 Tax=Hoplias malabaricus TaxID=27720 RepID=UPI003463699F
MKPQQNIRDGGSQFSQPQINITIRTGSSGIFPCNLKNNISTQSFSESPHVEWYTVSGTVFERSDEGLYQAEAYKDRVDVPKDKLLIGDCSLVIKSVRAEDAGVYESYLVVKQMESSLQFKRVFLQKVVLSVDDPPERELRPEDEREANPLDHGKETTASSKNHPVLDTKNILQALISVLATCMLLSICATSNQNQCQSGLLSCSSL